LSELAKNARWNANYLTIDKELIILEGNTYAAKWQKRGKCFRVFLDQDHSVYGSDVDFETACEILCLNICDRYGDGEAVLNLLREAPQPEGVSKYANPALVTLSWNESAYGETYQEGLFEGGYCAACKKGIGPRTNQSLVVDKYPKGDIGDFNQFEFSPLLLSSDFLTLFTESERKRFGLQEVICLKKTKKTFYEITGRPVLKQVGVKGADYHSLTSWECEVCGHKSFSCKHPEMPDSYKFSDFVSILDIPENLNEAFIIEDNIQRLMICMTLARWNEMNNHENARGVSADRVYVLPDEQIDRDPIVRIQPKSISEYAGPPCPHCGKILRTSLSKQCPHCFESWHE